jgi:hypothetical protein
MENEHFVSWGHEDDERLARALVLGLTVERVPGSVFHLRHPRGKDSNDRHQHYESNLKEFQRISKMDKEDLRIEVTSWPWRRESTVA